MEYPVWAYNRWPKIQSFILWTNYPTPITTHIPLSSPRCFLLFLSQNTGLLAQHLYCSCTRWSVAMSPSQTISSPRAGWQLLTPFSIAGSVCSAQWEHSSAGGQANFVERKGQLGPFRLWYKCLLKVHTMPDVIFNFKGSPRDGINYLNFKGEETEVYPTSKQHRLRLEW